MPQLKKYLSESEIANHVAEAARKISNDYKGTELIIIGVLTGAFMFVSDLVRKLELPVKLDFIEAKSYGDDIASSGKVSLTKELQLNIVGKDVLLVEDIVDTGITLFYLLNYLSSFNPNSIRVCTLIDKKERRKYSVPIDYAGHIVDTGFLVGYGLDYAGEYRHLPEIYILDV